MTERVTERDKQIGLRIRATREEAGLSQGDVAKKTAITQSALSLYELGQRPVSLAYLFMLSSILGKPVTYFLGIEDPTADPQLERIGVLYERLDARRKHALVWAAEALWHEMQLHDKE